MILALAVALAADLGRLRRERSAAGQLSAWASWVGEVPTAAELYSESANEAPSTEAFDDDDDDEELDASATNEYPDNDGDGDNDESYEDSDGKCTGATARLSPLCASSARH